MFIIFNILGLFIFLFLFWKKLKDDYLPNQIFSTATIILTTSIGLYFISNRYVFNWWFWITLAGFLTGLLFGIIKFKLKFFESFEALFLGFIICYSLSILGDSVVNSSLVSFIGFVVSVMIIGIYYYLDIHYKNFVWYKSGKVGFTGLTTAGIFFLIRAITASLYPYVYSFTPQYDIFLSAICSFIFFLLTYNLSRIES